MSLKNTIKLILLFLLLSPLGFSQDKKNDSVILVSYATKYKINKSSNYYSKFNSKLFISQTTSIFIDEMLDSALHINSMNIPSLEKAKKKDNIPKKSYSFNFMVVKDAEKGESSTISEFTSNRFFSYNEKVMDEKDWKIYNDTTTISGLLSYKAETDYAGRNWTAWFSPEIPISDGPYKFSGLPGLIVKLESSDGEYLFSLNEIKKLQSSVIPVQIPQYENVNKQKYKAMRQSLLDNPLNLFSGNMIVTVEGKELNEEELKNMLRKDLLNKNTIELD